MNEIIRCPRCYLRYEALPDSRRPLTAAEAERYQACPHCGSRDVGIGRSFDEACVDAVMRLRRHGENRVWRVSTHLIYTADVASDDRVLNEGRFADSVVHRVRLTEDTP